MSTERWRPIPGAEMYDVSDHGRVRSWALHRSGKRGTTPHLLSQATPSDNRPRVTIHGGREQMSRLVHQLVLLAFVGPRAEGQVTRHLDGDPTNNLLSNLRYGTQAENAQDSLRHGTHANARKVECPQGHPYDALNTRVDSRGRRCRACDRERTRASRARQRMQAAS